MKTCTACGDPKPIEEFSSYFSESRGKLRVEAKCKSCKSDQSAQWLVENKGKRSKYNAQVYQQRKKTGYYEKDYQNLRSYYVEKALKQRLADPEKLRQYRRGHYKNNKGAYLERNVRRKAALLKRTPRWLNREHIEQMREFYENTPPGYHVDHIIPLQGKNVSGLHVPWNLQYLPALENIAKKNKF